MNKKKLNIVLIPSAIVVWFIVLFRVVSFKDNKVDNLSINDRHDQNKGDIIQTDTLSLLLNYRDPFIPGKSFFRPEKGNREKTDIFRKPAEVILPSIIYKGLIDPGKNGKTVALTIIDSHSFLVCRGDIINDVKVKNIHRDSITIEYQNRLFTIKNTQ